jgi:hypothetical protein
MRETAGSYLTREIIFAITEASTETARPVSPYANRTLVSSARPEPVEGIEPQEAIGNPIHPIPIRQLQHPSPHRPTASVS